jgi:nucleoside-diphosphate-sugar epimerase
MRVLIFGGNRFLGVEFTARLLALGHEVTLFNRGTLEDPFGELVQRLRGDRSTDDLDRLLTDTRWDAVVDFALFTAHEAERTARVLGGRVGHYVMISTGQVYLVRDQVPVPAKETDFEGPLSPEPASGPDREDWRYGVDKRGAEAVIARAFPSTVLRLPMVHGGRDYRRRLDSVLWRLLDGQPLLLTRPEALCRHVYGPAVTRTISAVLARGPFNAAFNLATPEGVSVGAFVQALAGTLGAQAKIHRVDEAQLAAAGLEPLDCCPFNARWMSALDASAAESAAILAHEPLSVWLPAAAQAAMARWAGPPPSLAQRPAELQFLARV